MTEQFHSYLFTLEKLKCNVYAKNQYMNVRALYLWTPAVETTQISFSKWMVKQTGSSIECNTFQQ